MSEYAYISVLDYVRTVWPTLAVLILSIFLLSAEENKINVYLTI